MKTLSLAFTEALKIDFILRDADKYLAHIPKPGDPFDKKSETLAEHTDLVLAHAHKICQIHGLDFVYSNLATSILKQLKLEGKAWAEEWLMMLFVHAIAFHDFGKVNEYFQLDRMKNGDAYFKSPSAEVFRPRYGHSELGAYIFSVYHIEKIAATNTDDSEKGILAALVFLFSNTILLHHSPNLKPPKERVGRSQFIKFRDKIQHYLQLYQGFPTPDLANFCFEASDDIISDLENQSTDFALFALLRLNYSLLTASDYMATWHYGYQTAMDTEQHWGVFSEAKRDSLIKAARSAKEYNARSYTEAKERKRLLQHPVEANNHNLNILRSEMTVEMLWQIQSYSDQRIFYLEAPTGGGKTNLSMLAAAELLRANPELNKVFYVFPFTTLITQTHRSIKETLLLNDDDIAVLHSRAGFQTLRETGEYPEKDTDNESTIDGRYGNDKRDFLQNLFVLYPFTLLTHIRFFDILKSQRKDDIYLMHRLANSIVVIDEVQSYAPKQWDKILYLLNEYGQYLNIRFILMSATLPRLDKIEAVKRASKGQLPPVVDLLPNPKRYFLNANFKDRVQFRFDLLGVSGQEEIPLSTLAELVLAKSRLRSEAPQSNGRVFTIVEFIFKKSATDFHKEVLQLESFFDEIFVLSGTILEIRRREIIAFLKRHQQTTGKKVLLITTQVVEAGVDIDMDLGFKNISLIDSDEQLAGRVNRNVTKVDCEVWLFKVNEPSMLYKEDLRLKAMRNMTLAERQAVLQNKDFGVLYALVFSKIEEKNHSALVDNFQDDYLPLFKHLDFKGIHEKFKLIDQQTLSVFVPVELPLTIENEHGENEAFFSQNEVAFLTKANLLNSNGMVDGSMVWKLYRSLCDNKEKPKDYVTSKIEQKTLQGILAKFTFSLFDSPKIRLGLRSYSDETESFENYYVLSRFTDVYSLESGLDEQKLNQPDNFF